MLEKNICAQLILENGMRFNGKAFGYVRESLGEVVFTTGMTGYQEALTDPSFAGQIVTMTYPLIGNYGVNLEDMESERPHISALIIREKCDEPSNWRCEMSLDGFLKQHKIMGLEGVDTRSLTRAIRNNGAMKGFITVDPDMPDEKIAGKFDQYTNAHVVEQVTTKEKYVLEGNGLHLAVVDYGVKRSILKELQDRDCKLTVYPAFTDAEEILAANPDCIFLSSGPGNPMYIPQAIDTVKTLLQSKPIAGICLGHQVISAALGCRTSRMKFGHHGGNHPVKNIETGRVYITSQNHEYVVSELGDGVEATFVNVNDGTIEGIRHRTLPIASIQFHPEASPGPTDTNFLFDYFLDIIK